MPVPSCPVTVYTTTRYGRRRLKPGRIGFLTASEWKYFMKYCRTKSSNRGNDDDCDEDDDDVDFSCFLTHHEIIVII